MEPSESDVARLVLGYLEDECEEVAKIFLEQSPLLADCLALAKQGRKYTTKVWGRSLKDLWQEYRDAHCLLSERLQKLLENVEEQLKQSTSLVQQLKILREGSKSHFSVSEHSLKLLENAAEQLKQSTGTSLEQKLKILMDVSKLSQTFQLSITFPSQALPPAEGERVVQIEQTGAPAITNQKQQQGGDKMEQ